jgi:hypothetical protein
MSMQPLKLLEYIRWLKIQDIVEDYHLPTVEDSDLITIEDYYLVTIEDYDITIIKVYHLVTVT